MVARENVWGERPGEHVQIPVGIDALHHGRREGCDATAAQHTHGDADVACSLYVYSHCSCCEAIQVLMIVNEPSCKSPRDAWNLPAAPLVGLTMES